MQETPTFDDGFNQQFIECYQHEREKKQENLLNPAPDTRKNLDINNLHKKHVQRQHIGYSNILLQFNSSQMAMFSIAKIRQRVPNLKAKCGQNSVVQNPSFQQVLDIALDIQEAFFSILQHILVGKD